MKLRLTILATLLLFGKFSSAVSAGGTIMASDVTNLRASIDAKRNGCGLAPMTWTDNPLVAKVTPIKAVHINELRAGLVGLAVSSTVSTDVGALTAGKVIKAEHINELNVAIQSATCGVACGTAISGPASKTAPSVNLCGAGTASTPTTIVGTLSPWTWTCSDASGTSTVNCNLPKDPTYNTSVLSGTGQSPCGWFPSISSGSSWGCTCMTGVATTQTTCTANSFMTHGNNFTACVYTCNLKPTN